MPSQNGGARLIASATFYWNNKPHIIEIDLLSANYGYPTNHPPGLLVRKVQTDGSEYVVLDGPYFGITTTLQQDTFVYIPWYSILQQVIAHGWFGPMPTGPGAATTATIGLAVEVRNRAVADLYHTNFRIGG